jgi:hypothetical protein
VFQLIDGAGDRMPAIVAFPTVVQNLLTEYGDLGWPVLRFVPVEQK